MIPVERNFSFKKTKWLKVQKYTDTETSLNQQSAL